MRWQEEDFVLYAVHQIIVIVKQREYGTRNFKWQKKFKIELWHKKKKPLLCGILVYQEKGTVGSNGLSGHHWPLRMQSDTFRKVSSNTGIDGLVDIGLCRNLGWNRSANMPTT